MHHKIREYARLYEEGAIFTAFDTETTGLYCERDRIIEIGAVKFDKTGILGTYEILIYPEISVPASAYKVHGISDLMLSGCPVFAAAAPAFLDFIEGTRLIAHNAPFDTGFVNSELQRAGRPALASPSVPAADTVTLAQKAFPKLKKYNLQFLAGRFGIPSGTAHRAQDDAGVCREVFLYCIGKHEKQNAQPDLPF